MIRMSAMSGGRFVVDESCGFAGGETTTLKFHRRRKQGKVDDGRVAAPYTILCHQGLPQQCHISSVEWLLFQALVSP